MLMCEWVAGKKTYWNRRQWLFWNFGKGWNELQDMLMMLCKCIHLFCLLILPWNQVPPLWKKQWKLHIISGKLSHTCKFKWVKTSRTWCKGSRSSFFRINWIGSWPSTDTEIVSYAASNVTEMGLVDFSIWGASKWIVPMIIPCITTESPILWASKGIFPCMAILFSCDKVKSSLSEYGRWNLHESFSNDPGMLLWTSKKIKDSPDIDPVRWPLVIASLLSDSSKLHSGSNLLRGKLDPRKRSVQESSKSTASNIGWTNILFPRGILTSPNWMMFHCKNSITWR